VVGIFYYKDRKPRPFKGGDECPNFPIAKASEELASEGKYSYIK
jgi:hypothetical protein